MLITSYPQKDIYPLHGTVPHAIPHDGTELNIDLGKEGVPRDAYQVTILAYVKSGYLDSIEDQGFYKFSTQTRNGDIEKSLFFAAYHQQAFSFNSENIDLPVEGNQYITARIDKAKSYNIQGFVKVTGYRRPTK